jgi:intein/homing endonuclease
MGLKGSGLNVDDFFGSLVDSINDQLGHSDVAKDIIDFIDNVIDREGWGVKEVHRRQYLLFKTFYGLELDEEDIALLQAWYELDRTSINPEFYQSGVPFQSLCVEAGRRASKCITLDTLIPTNQGFIEAKELRLDPTVEWQSVDFNVAIPGKVTCNADCRFYNGFAEVKRIKTFNGYSIGATNNHRIKILDKSGLIRWEYMDNLRVGDVVCIERNSNLWAEQYQEVYSYFEKAKRDTPFVRLQSGDSPTFFDENYGYLLGLLCGDGSWTTANLVLTALKSDLEVYVPYIKKTFVGADLDYQYAVSKSVSNLRIGSVINKRFFEHLGFSSQDRDSKRVPWIIMKSPKKVVASFLSGLFDTDGTVSSKDVRFSTSSKKLAEEVQILLLNFGIVSRINSSFVKEKQYYVLATSDLKSRVIFSKEIGFRLPRKQDKLLATLNKSREGGTLESIPNQIDWLKRLLNCLPANSRGEELRSDVTKKLCGRSKSKLPYRTEFKRIVGNVLKPSSGEELTYSRVKNLLEWISLHSEINFDKEAVHHFVDLIEKDYFFNKIISIEGNKEETLDIGVPEHHCYTANGFTSHNSWSASVIVAYEFYKLCMLKSPQKKYNIATSTPIAIYCIATSATQTKKTIFGQAKALLEYIPPLKRLIDQKKLIIGEEEVKYPEKLLHIYSGNSNSASQVGSSVILLVMDEVARFDEGQTEDGESKAIELWSNIGISGTTFGVDAKKVAISSAWREGDAIQFLYNKAKTSNGWLGFRLRSWDLNPVHAGRDNPIVQGEYDLDPRKAALEFEGVRFNRAYSFFNDQEVERAFTGSSVLRVNVLPPADDNLVRLELKDIRRFTQSSVMHLDPAFVRDAYAIAFGHREVRSGEKVAVIDGLLAWEPDIGQQVGISNVYQAIYQIHGSRPLTKITSDHYNPETVQRLKMTGLNASIITFSQTKQLEIYDFARKLLHENRLILPKDSPWSNKLKEELFGIQLIKNRKIDHRKDGTKDLCDAVAVVAWHLMSDLSASISGTTIKTENREAKFQQGDANSDIAFGGAGRELAAQIKTSYKGWGTSRNDGGSWSGDDYF